MAKHHYPNTPLGDPIRQYEPTVLDVVKQHFAPIGNVHRTGSPLTTNQPFGVRRVALVFGENCPTVWRGTFNVRYYQERTDEN